MRDELVERLLTTGLDEAEALELSIVGAKAARLAAARRAGLPVLPGIVLRAGAAAEPLRAAMAVMAQRGTAAARLFLGDAHVPESLAPLVEAALGPGALLVARSSSPVEAGGDWAGAFSSYVAITADDLSTAVRGCWASMFGRDAAERFDALGLGQADAGMAVLVQPCVTPDPGGVALVGAGGGAGSGEGGGSGAGSGEGGGTVEVTVAERSLSQMLLGWDRGLQGVVGDDDVPRGPAVERFGADLVAAVARVARSCASVIGDNYLEWAYVEGEVLILQCRSTEVASRPDAAGKRPALQAMRSETAARAARIVSRYGGQVGDDLVLSWGLAPARPVSRQAPGLWSDDLASLPRLRFVADHLAAVAWGTAPAAALAEAHDVLEALRTRLHPAALARLANLEPVDWSDGLRLIAAVESFGARLAGSGALADPADVWRLSLAKLQDYLANPAGAAATGHQPLVPDPWHGFLFESVWANGMSAAGQPASEGEGAGRVLHLPAPRRLSGSLQRRVLYVPAPEPGFAPLLWRAAGLVAARGSAAAHLFDVARSLGVPAVAGCELADWEGADDLVAAVDGFTGWVAWL